MLQAANLTKRYGRLTALNDVSFSVREGEVLGLIGPNGSGKTTLFECLGGVLPLDGGTVCRTAGRSRRETRLPLFYLPDAIAPWPSQRCGWALDFVSVLSTASATCRDERHRAAGSRAAPRRADRDAVQRASASARCWRIGLLTPQPVLLADEPFDGLDLRQTRDVAPTLRAHAAGGRTLFLSIHQISDAARVCDRFVLLSGGRVCGEGTLAGTVAACAAARGATAGGDLEEVFLALT